MENSHKNNPFEAVKFDRILARTLATELTEEARNDRENTTLITSGTEETEES